MSFGVFSTLSNRDEKAAFANKKTKFSDGIDIVTKKSIIIVCDVVTGVATRRGITK